MDRPSIDSTASHYRFLLYVNLSWLSHQIRTWYYKTCPVRSWERERERQSWIESDCTYPVLFIVYITYVISAILHKRNCIIWPAKWPCPSTPKGCTRNIVSGVLCFISCLHLFCYISKCFQTSRSTTCPSNAYSCILSPELLQKQEQWGWNLRETLTGSWRTWGLSLRIWVAMGVAYGEEMGPLSHPSAPLTTRYP